jgi:hypothetical protein
MVFVFFQGIDSVSRLSEKFAAMGRNQVCFLSSLFNCLEHLFFEGSRSVFGAFVAMGSCQENS